MRNHIRGLTALLVVSALLPVACGTQKKGGNVQTGGLQSSGGSSGPNGTGREGSNGQRSVQVPEPAAGDDGIEGDIHRADSDESGAGDDTDAEPP